MRYAAIYCTSDCKKRSYRHLHRNSTNDLLILHLVHRNTFNHLLISHCLRLLISYSLLVPLESFMHVSLTSSPLAACIVQKAK